MADNANGKVSRGSKGIAPSSDSAPYLDNMGASNSQTGLFAGSEDTFQAALEVEIPPDFFQRLEQGKQAAQQNADGFATVDVFGDRWQIKRKGMNKNGLQFSYIIERGGCVLLIAKVSNPKSGRPNVLVEFGSLLLMQYGLERSWIRLNETFRSERFLLRRDVVSRVDFAVDFSGCGDLLTEFCQSYLNGRYITRAVSGGIFGRPCKSRGRNAGKSQSADSTPRRRATSSATESRSGLDADRYYGAPDGQDRGGDGSFTDAVYFRGRAFKGLSCGRGIVSRIYDKELESRRGDPVKRQWLIENRWGGRIPRHAVRIEFELKRAQLRTFGVDSVADLLDKRAEIVAYLTDRFFRFIQEKIDHGHHSRAVVSQSWKFVQSAFRSVYGTADAAVRCARRIAKPWAVLGQQVLGCLSSLFIAQGKILKPDQVVPEGVQVLDELLRSGRVDFVDGYFRKLMQAEVKEYPPIAWEHW